MSLFTDWYEATGDDDYSVAHFIDWLRENGHIALADALDGEKS